MKKNYLLIIAIIWISGCKLDKTGLPGPNTISNVSSSTGITGIYALYQTTDSIYNYQLNGTIEYDITSENIRGDTAYLNVGSKNLIVEPNPVANYNPSYAMSDTISFTSTTMGIEKQFGVVYPITYSISTGYFSDGSVNSDYTSTIMQINNSVIKVNSVEKAGGIINNTHTKFFKKQ